MVDFVLSRGWSGGRQIPQTSQSPLISLWADCLLAICNDNGKQNPTEFASSSLYSINFQFYSYLNLDSWEYWIFQICFKVYHYKISISNKAITHLMIISNRRSIYQKWVFRCWYQIQNRSTPNEQWSNIERPFTWGRYLFHQTQTCKDSKMCFRD